MEKLKKKIKMHSLKVVILWLFLVGIIVVLLLVSSINFKSLTSYCEVYNETDLNKCYKENPYVEIHGTEIFDGEYDYIHNNKRVARFASINLNDYFLASLIETDKAKEMMNEETENIVIRGKLEKFNTGAKLNGYNAMKELYVRYLSESATREEVLNNFTLVQLNQYGGSKINIYVIAAVAFGFIVLFIVLALKQCKYIFHPEKYELNKNIKIEDEKEVEKILKELESENYDFHQNDIYITKNYLISKTGRIAVAQRSNVVWIYEHIIKQKGITTGKSWLVYSLDRKTPFNFSGFGKKHKEIGEKLQELFPNATFGYSDELANLWNKNPEKLMKKGAEVDKKVNENNKNKEE